MLTGVTAGDAGPTSHKQNEWDVDPLMVTTILAFLIWMNEINDEVLSFHLGPPVARQSLYLYY